MMMIAGRLGAAGCFGPQFELAMELELGLELGLGVGWRHQVCSFFFLYILYIILGTESGGRERQTLRLTSRYSHAA